MTHRATLGALALLTALSVSDAPAQVADAPAAGELTAAETRLGVLRLRVDPGARITADEDLTDQVLTLSFWRQTSELAPQLRGLELPGLRSFTVVEGRGSGLRLDLRLAPTVKAAAIVRRGADTLEIAFSDQLFAGAAVRLARREGAAPAAAPDPRMWAALNDPVTAAPTSVYLEPFWFPVGAASLLSDPLTFEPLARSWGFVPPVVRDAWLSNATVAEAISRAEQGDPRGGARLLQALPTPDDASRVLLALARGWVQSRPGPSGAAANDGVAAEAFQLAAALAPDAEWEPWARGRAAYHFERIGFYDDALLMYRAAIAKAPDHRERPWWELGLGVSLFLRGRTVDALDQLAIASAALPADDGDARFEARRTALFALLALGDHARAARVLDLLLEEHPALANTRPLTLTWGLVLLRSGRGAQARPWLERIETTASHQVQRQRARWWLHDAALLEGDLEEARRALRRILEQTPGSALVPMAKMRLQVLDLLATKASERQMTWPQLSIRLREIAQEWPHTPLEDEALSLAAQIFLASGLLDDGLHLYGWVEERTPTVGGAVAYEDVICRYAPASFRELRARGESVAALGVWTRFLESPEASACVEPQEHAEAAATAVNAGLPDLALRWLGRAVAEGRGGAEDAANLLTMSAVYLGDGRPEAARRTLEFVENSDLPLDDGRLAEAWADLLHVEGDGAAAAAAYSEAIAEAATSVRRRAAIPGLRYRRGLARTEAGVPGGDADLIFGLENGGVDHAATGWIALAGRRQRACETDSARADWAGVLSAADAALAAEPVDDEARAARWHRASALLGLERLPEAGPLLRELAAGDDAWAIQARRSLGSLEFEGQLDDRTVDPP